MKNLNKFEVVELNFSESMAIDGGGPIIDGIKWYYRTMGSFWHGVYDGIVGNEPDIAI